MSNSERVDKAIVQLSEALIHVQECRKCTLHLGLPICPGCVEDAHEKAQAAACILLALSRSLAGVSEPERSR